MVAQREQPPPTMTAEEFFERRDEFEHCELVNGEIAPMSPTGRPHGRVELRLGRFLDEWAEERGAEVVTGEVGYRLAADTVRAVDVSVHCDPPPDAPGFEAQLPDLVVEVVSPRDSWAAVERKVDAWLGAGVREVWIADPSRELVVSLTSGDRRTFDRDDALTSPLLEGFSVQLARVFRR